MAVWPPLTSIRRSQGNAVRDISGACRGSSGRKTVRISADRDGPRLIDARRPGRHLTGLSEHARVSRYEARQDPPTALPALGTCPDRIGAPMARPACAWRGRRVSRPPGRALKRAPRRLAHAAAQPVRADTPPATAPRGARPAARSRRAAGPQAPRQLASATLKPEISHGQANTAIIRLARCTHGKSHPETCPARTGRAAR
jgi:hypothetical protein